jgi:hypothetical protein
MREQTHVSFENNQEPQQQIFPEKEPYNEALNETPVSKT